MIRERVRESGLVRSWGGSRGRVRVQMLSLVKADLVLVLVALNNTLLSTCSPLSNLSVSSLAISEVISPLEAAYTQHLTQLGSPCSIGAKISMLATTYCDNYAVIFFAWNKHLDVVSILKLVQQVSKAIQIQKLLIAIILSYFLRKLSHHRAV